MVERKDRVSRNTGNRFVIATLEDQSGQIECLVSGRTVAELDGIPDLREPVLITGTYSVDRDEGRGKILANRVVPLEQAQRMAVHGVRIAVDLQEVVPDWIRNVRELVRRHPGPVPLSFDVRLEGLGRILWEAGPAWTVSFSPDFARELETAVGKDSYELL
jgi:DNA polymerase-3 subunit alpha